MMRASTSDWLPVGQPAILVVLMLVIGVVVGWGITRPFAGTSAHDVTNADYVAVVAQLFQKDHNVEVAKQRLALLGSPTVLVEQTIKAGDTGNAVKPADRAAINALAQALQVPVAPTTKTSASTGAAPAADVTASPSVATPGASATGSTTSSSSASGHISWEGPVVAFVLAFVLGAIVLMRTAGLGIPSFNLPRVALPERPPRRPSSPRVRSESATFQRPSAARRSSAALEDDVSDVELDDDSEPSDWQQPARSEPVRERVEPRGFGFPAARSRPTVAPRRLSFQSVYRNGDDPFDEIHPITHPRNGSLIAACGLSAALKVDSVSSQCYYAFTAWLQDYAEGDQLNAVGLTTEWALAHQRARIDSWLQAGQIDNALPVQPGMTAELRTGNVMVAVSIPDVEFGTLSGEPEAYFSSLTTHFDVQIG